MVISGKTLEIDDAVSWIQNVLPDVPSVVDSSRRHVTYFFRSSLIGTYVMVECIQKGPETEGLGLIRIQSDNYSVLTILKDHIFSMANSRNVPIHIESDLKDLSVMHVLSLLHPLV